MYRDKQKRKTYFNAMLYALCPMLLALCPMRYALYTDVSASVHPVRKLFSNGVKKGNNLYRQGKYDEALKYYNEAEVENPNSDVISFDKGAALYKKGDYEKAIKAFNKALLSDNPGIEEKASFNIGNSKYHLGRLKVNTDLASAIKLYRQALDYYKRAIELNQNNTNAKYNHEFVERELKILLDKLKKQKSSSTKASKGKQKQAQQSTQEKGKGEQKQKKLQVTTSKEGEKKQEQKQQATQQVEKEKEGKQKEETQKQAKGYKAEEAQKEMSEEEARMILKRYNQQDQLFGNVNRSAKSRYLPVLKDW